MTFFFFLLFFFSVRLGFAVAGHLFSLDGVGGGKSFLFFFKSPFGFDVYNADTSGLRA